MEKEEKSYVRNLLDLKHANSDMFYRVLSEMEIDSLNNLCQIEEFSELCKSSTFWEKLWKQKITFPFRESTPEKMKRDYLRHTAISKNSRYYPG